MILLDIGHATLLPDGRIDYGAEANGIREADLALEVGIMAASGIRALGYRVGLTRCDNTPITQAQRTALITAPHVTAVVSIHANAWWFPTALGWEIFVSAHGTESRRLGRWIGDQWATNAAIPPRKPPIKTWVRSDGKDRFYVIRDPAGVGIPAVLVEMGFLTNELDASCLREFWGKFRVAHLLAMGVAAFAKEVK